VIAPARVGALAVVALALTGCGKKGPPSGGPPDIEPPRVIASSPDSGAAGVPRDLRPSLTFSEAMEPRATGEAIELAPRVEIRQRRWSGRTVTLVLAESLRANQTYTAFVGGTARDRHGNPIVGGASVVFTTAASMPPGALAGKIVARGFSATGTYLWCYRDGREPDSTARDFDALGIADAEGEFRIVGLEVPAKYRLWAFADLNRNRSYEPPTDLLVAADTTLALDRAEPMARGLELIVVNPRAPGRVRGTVLDSLAIASGNVAVIAVSPDSVHRVQATMGEQLAFDVSLAAGMWRLRAFRDLDRDGQWQPTTEPASDELEISVAPAADIVEVQLVLKRPTGR
jgi:Big-like domain-containing protein